MQCCDVTHVSAEITVVDASLLRRLPRYNSTMSLIDQIQKDIVTAMKAREEQRLSTLRMVKTALKNREIDKMAPLDDKESQQVLSTLIKQRKESVEQFTKGGRQEMADKEAAEIMLIEAYLPKAAGEEHIAAGVKAVIAEMGSPTMKDMGTVMKNVMARFAGEGIRVDGKGGQRGRQTGINSEIAREQLGPIATAHATSSEDSVLSDRLCSVRRCRSSARSRPVQGLGHGQTSRHA